MSARPLWKGVLRFSDARVPVSLYSCLEDQRVHFHLLHNRDQVPVRQHMVNPVTRREVVTADIRRGYPVDSGTLVVLRPEELAELEPEASREIEITRFVAPEAISSPWYSRPYHLGPDGDTEAYFALAEALRREHRVGIARWVMRKRRYVGALGSDGQHLALITLRHAGEVVAASELPAPAGRALDRRELALAEQLVSALAGDFDPTVFHDEYRERVHELVQAKAQGRVIAFPKRARARATEAPLENVLRASLKQVKPRHPARKEKMSA